MEEATRRAALSDLLSMPGHLLWRAQARVGAAVADVLPGRSDLHAYAALLALADLEPRSQQSLANLTGVSGTTMTTVAEALLRDGLVERIRNPLDRRSYALTRTPAGRDAVRRWEPDVQALEQRLTEPLTPRRGRPAARSPAGGWSDRFRPRTGGRLKCPRFRRL